MFKINLYFSIIMILSSAAPAVFAADSKSILLQQETFFDDLPDVIRRRASPALTASEFHQFLDEQPMLILDGATLHINPPRVGSTQFLSISRLELKRNALIITQGVNLEISASLIVADSSSAIISFPDKTVAGPAQAGANGESGLNAGIVIINDDIDRNSIFRIRLNGQAGQAGGPGLQGPRGVAGTQGDNAADHLFDCAHGGGRGGNGGPGGQGGNGGNGGAGGDGGKLILRGKIAAQRTQIEFAAPGGLGGAGGARGLGGPGGPGGQGGRGSKYCGGGPAGSDGPQGPWGGIGLQGQSGRVGTISAD
jgi:hypothetical protein